MNDFSQLDRNKSDIRRAITWLARFPSSAESPSEEVNIQVSCGRLSDLYTAEARDENGNYEALRSCLRALLMQASASTAEVGAIEAVAAECDDEVARGLAILVLLRLSPHSNSYVGMLASQLGTDKLLQVLEILDILQRAYGDVDACKRMLAKFK